MRFETAQYENQGTRRVMEDRTVVVPRFRREDSVYVGLYDGHFNARAAEHARRTLYFRFGEALDRGLSAYEAFIEAYDLVDKDLAHIFSGTCAADLFFEGEVLTSANVGDVEAFHYRHGVVRKITEIHNIVDNIAERIRVLDAIDWENSTLEGNRITIKGKYDLNMSRALGDAKFREAGVISTPFVKTHHVRRGDRFLCTTDGYRVIENETPGVIHGLIQDAPTPEALIQEVKRRYERALQEPGDKDSISAVAIYAF